MNSMFIADIPWKQILAEILTFAYSIAHYSGTLVIYLVNLILPKAQIASDLADPIGYLAILTAFLLLAQVARKIAWIVVMVGWVLVVIRVLMSMVG